MIAFLLILSIFATSYGAVFPSGARIVGGGLSPIEQAPYQVSISDDYTGEGDYYHSCGGVIVTPGAILTAAHCTRHLSGSGLKIRAGSPLHATGGVTRFVSRFKAHRNYKGGYDYDIALLFLEQDLVLQSGPAATISAVKLPEQGADLQAGVLGFVTGWGATEESGNLVDELRYVQMPIVDRARCREILYAVGNVTELMLCAGGGRELEHDACYGDNGGALTAGGVLMGLVSWGYGCGREGYPKVFTNVGEFRTWIDSTLS